TYTHYYTHYYGEETPGEPPRDGGSVVQRALDRARGWLGGGRSSGAAQEANGTRLSVATLPSAERTSAGRNGRSRNVLLAIVAVLGAVGALAAVVVWRSGGFEALSPRDLLRQRLMSPTSAPVPPPRPNPPPTTRPPPPRRPRRRRASSRRGPSRPRERCPPRRSFR